MNVEPGTTLLHYRVADKIGEGGMGVVWKAVDTTLDRTVAIKLLPQSFSSDPERLARFEREAKTLAALNHSNIAGIYGFHEEKGQRFLSMEFVEGQDLAARLRTGPLPVDEAVAIARGIAGALGVAHAQGIVHRDLKPGNVMLTPDGEPKVLDFGLAKAISPEQSDPGTSSIHPSLSPTITSLGTAVGVILGTAGYMSPEQARGKPVDRRADLWSFGVVLYEMLTGRAPFTGETVSDTLACVLKSDVDWNALPPGTPPPVYRLLKRCLQRKPKDRLHDANDARLELEHAFDEEETIVGAAVPAGWSARRGAGLAALTLVVGLALGALFLGTGTEPITPSRPLVSSLLAPPNVNLYVDEHAIALSPDGEKLAFAGVNAEGRVDLYIRELDTGETNLLAGTEGARTPFWSPDGAEIGFHVGQRLLSVSTAGSAPRQIAETVGGAFGASNSEGTILFTTRSAFFRVDAEGGVPEQIELPFRGALHSKLQFLPGGRRYLFDFVSLDHQQQQGIYVRELGSTEMRRVGYVRSNGFYANGRLLYVKDGHLVAQPFDPENAELFGEPQRVAGPLLGVNYPFHYFFHGSADGSRLVYIPGDVTTGLTELVWVDRSGAELERTGIVGDLYHPRLSHDGLKLAVDISTPETHGDLWVFDLARGSSRQVTSDPIDESRPTWSGDNSELYFFRIPDLYAIDADRQATERLVYSSQARKSILDLTRDGRHLLFHDVSGGTADLKVLDVEQGTERLWKKNPAASFGARFSPDGNWIVYNSGETGRSEVYLERFPDRGERFRVSNNGGLWPKFRPDGKELFYVSLSGEIVAVSIDMESGRDPIGEPVKLFSARLRLGNFDVTADGKRFLLNQYLHFDVNEMVLLQDYGLAASE